MLPCPNTHPENYPPASRTLFSRSLCPSFAQPEKFMPTPTPGYQTKQEIITVGRSDYTIRSLLDRQQYSDPQGEAEAAGIPPATWPLFGLLWPSSRVLAGLMDNHNLIGKRVLEIGAGLALASLVVHRRLGDITASDWHPLSPGFLAENVLLNHLSPLKYQRGNWAGENPELGEFDLIIGSDILYERQQPQQLATPPPAPPSSSSIPTAATAAASATPWSPSATASTCTACPRHSKMETRIKAVWSRSRK